MQLQKQFLYLLTFAYSASIFSTSILAQQLYEYAVIGAGPAGIISVGQLLEHGVHDHEIVWIDPEFAVGRMGKYYGNVPSNQKAHRFTTFLDKSSIFSVIDTLAVKAMRAYDPQQEHPLQLAVDVLKDIIDLLGNRVRCKQDCVQFLNSEDDKWRITLKDGTMYARKVILATGSYPKTFNYENIQEIPLDIALDEEKLKRLVSHEDVIMVMGSAHSALLVVKYLHDFGVKKIINIYTKQPTFGKFGGLEGITAYWTQNVLLANPPANIVRMFVDPATIQEHIAVCNKIIYAVGYEAHKIPINGSKKISYDFETGRIQKNLYGIGIAFPEPYQTENGTTVYLIGVNSFI